MQMKVEIDVTDRLAEILRAAIVALGSPLVSVAASAPEQADSPHPEERERRYETPVSPPPPPAEGKRGRGRPRKDEQPPAEQPPAEQPPAEQPPAEGIDPNELWARAKLVAGSSKEHAQAIRDALSVMGVMRLSAVPPDKFGPFNACLDRLYEGEDIAEAIAALTEEISK